MFPPGLNYEMVAFYNITLGVFDGAGGHSISLEFSVNITDDVDERPVIQNLPNNITIIAENFTTPQLVYGFDVATEHGLNLAFEFEIEPDDGRFYLYPSGSIV